MAQGTDDITGELLPGFKLPTNGNTELLTVGLLAVTAATVSTGGFYEISASALVYAARGIAPATIPAVGVMGAMPINAGTPAVVAIPAGMPLSVIGTVVGTSVWITKL